ARASGAARSPRARWRGGAGGGRAGAGRVRGRGSGGGAGGGGPGAEGPGMSPSWTPTARRSRSPNRRRRWSDWTRPSRKRPCKHRLLVPIEVEPLELTIRERDVRIGALNRTRAQQVSPRLFDERHVGIRLRILLLDLEERGFDPLSEAR